MSDRKFVNPRDVADAMARLQQILGTEPAPSPKPSHALATTVLALAMLALSWVLAPIATRHGGPSACDPPGSECLNPTGQKL